MDKPQTFEQSWEAFRLEKEIPQEAFVASGYGFVEDLEEFVGLQKWARIVELEAKLIEANDLLLESKAECVMWFKNTDDASYKLKIATEALFEIDKFNDNMSTFKQEIHEIIQAANLKIKAVKASND
jgi:hypothetical protein